jgi:enoyl-CoA hydratase
MEKPVLFEIKEEIAVITLNRPERRNAINQELLLHLYNHLEEANRRDDVRAAIITGNGKSFCSGIDLDAVKTENLFDPRGDGTDLPDLFNSFSKPIIGAINGHAITGGFEIALNCDFLIASERASFRDTHVRVQIHPGWGISQLLQEAVGIRRAKEISLSSKIVDAEEAFRIGLVNEVVPHDRLMERTEEICSEIKEADFRMIRKMKQLINSGREAPLKDSFENERKGFRKFVSGFMKIRDK